MSGPRVKIEYNRHGQIVSVSGESSADGVPVTIDLQRSADPDAKSALAETMAAVDRTRAVVFGSPTPEQQADLERAFAEAPDAGIVAVQPRMSFSDLERRHDALTGKIIPNGDEDWLIAWLGPDPWPALAGKIRELNAFCRNAQSVSHPSIFPGSPMQAIKPGVLYVSPPPAEELLMSEVSDHASYDLPAEPPAPETWRDRSPLL